MLRLLQHLLRVVYMLGSRQLDQGKAFSAWTFYTKRFARLAPTYFLTNLAAAIMIFALSEDDEDLGWMAWIVPMTMLGITSWSPVPYLPLNEVTWLVSTLMAFYVLFPFLAPRVQRSARAVGAACSARSLIRLEVKCGRTWHSPGSVHFWLRHSPNCWREWTRSLSWYRRWAPAALTTRGFSLDVCVMGCLPMNGRRPAARIANILP